MAEAELRQLIMVLQGQVETILGRLDITDQQTNNTMAQMRAELQQCAATLNRDGGAREKMRLISERDLKPTFFKGEKGEDFREWAKKTKLFLNLKCNSFRAALTWAEQQQGRITDQDIAQQRWPDQAEGNPKLYDYLCSVLEKEPLNIAEKETGNGLEAWRRLAKRFNPHGGQHDMDRYESLVYGTKAAKNLQELPRMIEAWENKLKISSPGRKSTRSTTA